ALWADTGRADRGTGQSNRWADRSARRPHTVSHDGRRYGLRRASFQGIHPSQQLCELQPTPINAALDGPYGATNDRRGLFVGEAGTGNQDKCLALLGRNLRKGAMKVLQIDVPFLLRRAGPRLCLKSVRVGHFTSLSPALGNKRVAHDREQPCLKV